MIVLFSLLYFCFIYDKKNYIGNHLSHDDDYWYYDGEWTCVSFGNPTGVCDVNKGVCAGGDTFGDLESQKLMAERSDSKNKNKIHGKSYIHDRCPIIY